jgi:hypothetical protein
MKPFPHSSRRCDGTPHLFRGSSGERMVGCKGCSTYVLAASLEPRRPLTSGYVCGSHPEEAVTWRGTGCAECARETQARNYRERKVLRDWFV